MNHWLEGALGMASLKWGAIGALGLGAFGILLAVTTDAQGAGALAWNRYIAYIERELRSMFNFTNPKLVAYGQLVAGFVSLIVAASLGAPAAVHVFIVVAAALGPYVAIKKMKADRRTLIESQVEQMLVALANALKSTPSIGAAFTSVIDILPAPINQEIDLMVKEVKVGSTLEQGLLAMAQRVGSTILDSALSAILIGRQVGGNLPKILETTAATLREMGRLDGVLRTKTAEGKVQLYVIAAMPGALIVGLNSFWPGYFDAMSSTASGMLAAVMAMGFWAAGIILARRILAVQV